MPRSNIAPVLFIPHGGGPMPLLDEPPHTDAEHSHAELIAFLQALPASFAKPSAIVVISAHWEETVPTITGSAQPGLIYDYYGFPPQSYQFKYPAPGAPKLAARIQTLLQNAGFTAHIDNQRGIDHGVFVPLMLMYPAADISLLQLSLIKGLDGAQHIAMGKALAALRDENVLILGSGFSFHNLRAFGMGGADDALNTGFERWLEDTLSDPSSSANDKAERLCAWDKAPGGRHCHPREEHLLPLHVCFGAGLGSQSVGAGSDTDGLRGDNNDGLRIEGLINGCAIKRFDGRVLGKKTSAWQW
ncbi:dioxygenase [Shewanella sp. JM162201]|uniref:Dioxygenase n=1 Tax=Shewanella jiangmenensis TaxID=2837387 RepID=A0ABS5V188_9GAMM|nr:class III extradiol ring-cleavage dioxygenase [Shewanella jiangmenensis]MBT1443675.1 dioxygenase [Shewanella jiangmenensis]